MAGSGRRRWRARGPFRHRGFALFWWARFINTFATEAVSVAVGWQVYDLTHNPFDLGLVGLILFAPSPLLVLVTGAASDRFNRRMIFSLCQAAEAVAVAGLVYFTIFGGISIGLIFALLLILGVARAFMAPATQ